MPDLDLDELRRLAEEHRDGDSFRARLARGVLALLGRSESEQRQRERAERELAELERKAAAWDALARTGGTGSTPAVTRDDLIDRLERELAEVRARVRAVCTGNWNDGGGNIVVAESDVLEAIGGGDGE